MKLVSIPVVPPNGPGGAFLVNCKDENGDVIGYPEGTQTHGYVNPEMVAVIAPAPEGKCYISFYGNPIAHLFAVEAFEARVLIAGRP